MDIAMPARMMRLWTARTRIVCFLAAIMPFAVFARTIAVPPQPVSPYDNPPEQLIGEAE